MGLAGMPLADPATLRNDPCPLWILGGLQRLHLVRVRHELVARVVRLRGVSGVPPFFPSFSAQSMKLRLRRQSAEARSLGTFTIPPGWLIVLAPTAAWVIGPELISAPSS